MKRFTRLLISFTFALAAVGFVFQPAQAINLGGADVKKAATTAGYDSATTNTTLAQNIGSAVRILLSLVGIIFTALMVFAGFLWMTAKGDEAKVDKAQEIIRAAIIGLVITLASYAISEYIVPAVLDRMGAGGNVTSPPGQASPLQTGTNPTGM